MASPLLSLEGRVGNLLSARRQTVAAVESCTGGLILHRLTNIPGSSAYVMGGFVTYSNDAKMKFVGVQPNTLESYGAVSEQTAREMVIGCRAAFGVDIALSATGIVGPSGATETKPVGLVYIGLATADRTLVRQFNWLGDRETNKAHTADAALTMLLEALEEVTP